MRAPENGASLRLHVLGGLEVYRWTGDRWVAVPAQLKRLTLFAYLAVIARPVRRDVLLGVFWPESSEASARGALSKALHYLRATLGAECVSATDETIAITATVSDVAEHRRLLGEGRVADALQLYRGPLCDGVNLEDAPEFERWLDSERARSESDLTRAVHGALDDCEKRGAQTEAIALCRSLLNCIPLDERAVRRLMLLLDSSGDRAGALLAFDRFESAMKRALDIEPGPETQQLAASIRQRATVNVTSSEMTSPPPIETKETGELPAPELSVTTSSGEGRSATASDDAQHVGLRRYPARWGVLALVGALALGAVVKSNNRSGADANRRPDAIPLVVVAPFVDQTNDSTLATLSTMAADWITQGLSQSTDVRVLPMTTMLMVNAPAGQVSTPPDDRDAAARLARETGAGTVVTGMVYRRGDTLVFSATAIDTRSRAVTAVVDPVRAPVSNALVALDTLRARVLVALAPQLDVRFSGAMRMASRPRSLAAYDAYVRGLLHFTQADWPGALRSFREAIAADTGWVLPVLHLGLAASNVGDTPTIDSVISVLRPKRIVLAPYDQAGFDAIVAWRTGDRLGAYDAARRAAQLAPSGMAAAQVGKEAFALGRPREAVRVFGSLDARSAELRNYVLYWIDYADALHASANHEEEQRLVALADSAGFAGTPWHWRLRMRAGIARRDARIRNELLDTLDGGWLRVARSLQAGMTLQELTEESLAHGDTILATTLATRGARWYSALPDSILAQPRVRQRRIELLWLAGDSAQANALVDALPAEARDVVSNAHRAVVAQLRGNTTLAARWLDALSRSSPIPRYGIDALWRARLLASNGDAQRAVASLRAASSAGWSYRTNWHTDPWLRRSNDGALRRLIEPTQ
jgi:DNA-binding SARP family transcriptional activator/TolB-like protein